jgi:putative serine protease PepD
VTTGIVSGLNRTITAPSGFSISGAVQTDAAINPGNSGGPLLDAGGRVIGVNSQIATQSGSNSGVGFAIPVDQVKKVMPVLEKGQKVQHAYLGVSVGDATSGSGAVLAAVQSGGPAAGAGLKAGDTVTAIDGTGVSGADALTSAVNSHQPGDQITLSYVRGGAKHDATVKLGTRPARAPTG